MQEQRYTFTTDWFSTRIPTFEKYLSPLNERQCNVLEVGSFEGRSTTWLADNLLKHSNSKLLVVDKTKNELFTKNIESTGRKNQIEYLIGESREVLRTLPLRSFDFIYIDGSHQTINVIEDAIAAFQLAKDGAIIAFDDYLWDDPRHNKFGVPKPALDAFLSLYAMPDRYAPVIEVLEKNWQLWVRKISNRPR